MKLRSVLYSLGTLFIFIIPLGYFGGMALIKHQAKSFAKDATSAYHKDKTESLLMLIDSENHTF